ncbi:hypothetical protein RvVAR0630_pl03230 (plasmid) [Agrobacterium vitis]|nr:hypothetical protein RvVAR0630_pl03230 [Agrobacterium vitis]
MALRKIQETFSHFNQKPITCRMAVKVVNRFEPVEVDKAKGDSGTNGPRFRQLEFKIRKKRSPVW